MNYTEALNYLYSFINYEKGFSKYEGKNYQPDKVEKLLRAKNVEFSNQKFIHIAGTNGKGTTARALSAIFEAGGKSTGVYTSPHVYSLTERITLGTSPISEEETAELITEFGEFLKMEHVTFFEALTFIAVVYFIRNAVDNIILETGLGGRLDSTNFCHPQAVIITPVSYDHTGLLGKTLEQIAAEKGGIIKKNVPLILGLQYPEVRNVLTEIAGRKSSDVIDIAEHYEIHDRSPQGSKIDIDMSVENNHLRISGLSFPQVGDVFAQNFVTALAAYLAVEINSPSEQQLSQAARFESAYRLKVFPSHIIDVSHNPASLEALLHTIHSYLSEQIDGRSIHIYLGTLADKEIVRIAQVMRENRDKYHRLTIFDFPTDSSQRKSGGHLIYEEMKNMDGVDYCDNIRRVEIDRSEFQVFTGSFYAVRFYPEVAP